MYCFARTFWFHEDNNHQRKLATLIVVSTWAAIEVGAAFGVADIPDQFLLFRLVVGALLGRMWGIEVNNFAGVELTHRRTDDEDGDD